MRSPRRHVAVCSERISGIISLYPRIDGFQMPVLLSGWRFFFFRQATQEILMNIHEGDSVMHWTHGLGTVVQLEERALSGQSILYYAIQIGNMTVWVPADDMLETRLRLPTHAAEFKRLIGTLSHPGEPLLQDRRERKTLLMEWLKDGRTVSLFRVVRSLSTDQQAHSLNLDEETLLNR